MLTAIINGIEITGMDFHILDQSLTQYIARLERPDIDGDVNLEQLDRASKLREIQHILRTPQKNEKDGRVKMKKMKKTKKPEKFLDRWGRAVVDYL